MARAKVGDYIKVTDPGDNEMYYREGAGGKVVKVDNQGALVSFTHGEFNSGAGGRWWIEHGEYTVEHPYSSTFTESAKAAAPQGHTADGGGLQRHSIGDIYPLCVVGYSRDATYTMYVVEDLERGTVACDRFGTPLQWRDSRAAGNFARTVDRTTTGAPPWFKGRPNFELQLNLTLKREG